jgi:hypothetical protein
VRAIDSNVIVRILVKDDKRQAKAARGAMEGGIATTVLLESEGVLRSGYDRTSSLTHPAARPGLRRQPQSKLDHFVEITFSKVDTHLQMAYA